MTKNTASKNEKKPQTIKVTGKELSEYLGITDRRIRQLADEKKLVRTSAGKYDLKASINTYIELQRIKVTSKNASSEQLEQELTIEKLEHERIKKRKSELQVHIMERKLHNSEDVEEVWNRMALTIKTRILALPIRVGPQILGSTDLAEVQSLIKKEVYGILNELANYDVNQFNEVENDDGFEL